MLKEKLSLWDQPIGGLISRFFDFDRNFDRNNVAHLQAQLLAIYEAEQGRTEKTNLFALSQNDIADKVAQLSIPQSAIETARAKIDAGCGMPGGVPAFGLIAKNHGFVASEICDALLIAQAGARITLYGNFAAGRHDAVLPAIEDRLFAFVGQNANEPPVLQAAQAAAHMASIYAAMNQQLGQPMTNGRFATLGQLYAGYARDLLAILGQDEASEELNFISQIPYDSRRTVSLIDDIIIRDMRPAIFELLNRGFINNNELAVIHEKVERLATIIESSRPVQGAPVPDSLPRYNRG